MKTYASRWSPGDQIFKRRFEVIQVFPGSMGVVYLLRNENPSNELPEMLVSKTLSLEAAKDPTLCRRFLEEAKTWVGIFPSDNVVRAYYCDRFLEEPYIFAEYIAPGLLPNMLSEWIHRRLTPPPICLHMIIQVLDGLQHAYNHGVLFHGDLKPSNIMINHAGVAKVSDWGLSRSYVGDGAKSSVLSSGDSPELRVADSLCSPGTPGYAAPELSQGCSPSPASDLYSIGVILGQMLGGRILPPGISCKQIEKYLSVYPLYDNELSELALIMHSLLTPKPEERPSLGSTYSSLYELFIALTGLPSLQYVSVKTDPVWQRQKAFSMMALGDKQRGFEIYSKSAAEKKGAHSVDDTVLMEIDSGHITLSVGLLEKLEEKVDANPGDIEVLKELANFYAMVGRTTHSLELYGRALKIDQHNEDTLSAMVDLLKGDKARQEERLELARRLCDATPKSSRNLTKLAKIYYEIGLVEEALASCAAAEQCRDQSIDDLLVYGDILFKSDHLEDAYAIFRQVTQANPASGLGWYNLGVCQFELGKKDSAMKSWMRAAEHEESRGHSLVRISALLLERNKLAEGAALLKTAAELSPDNPKAWFNLAQCERAAGKPEDALRFLDTALKIDPEYELAIILRQEIMDELPL